MSKVNVEQFCNSVNKLTFRMFGELAKGNNNVVCSPRNVVDALALLYPAAQGETAAAMKAGLYLDASAEQTLRAIAELKELFAADEGVTLKTASGVWTSNSFPFSTNFIRLLREACKSQFSTVDFKPENNEAIAKDINDWVGQQTLSSEGVPLIKDLVKAEMLTEDTKMVLLSAIYFLAMFKLQFDPNRTRKQPFHLADGRVEDCQMMTQQDYFLLADVPAGQIPGWPATQALTLDYAGDAVLTVLLPETAVAPTGLDDVAFWQVANAGTVDDTVVMLPKFKIESGFDLKESLTALGMGVLFEEDADFGGACETGSCPGLKVTKAVHKAFIDTTEKGTEAGGGTAIIVGLESCRMDTKPPRMFIADRPFTFVIWNRSTRCVLFTGQHNKPAGY